MKKVVLIASVLTVALMGIGIVWYASNKSESASKASQTKNINEGNSQPNLSTGVLKSPDGRRYDESTKPKNSVEKESEYFEKLFENQK